MRLIPIQTHNNSKNLYFGANIYLDNELKQIIQSERPVKLDFLRNMFESFNSQAPVLFTLTKETEKDKRKIVAINLNNGQVYSQKTPATRIGLNNLIGFLMHKNHRLYEKFWDSPNRLKCKFEYKEDENGSSILTISKKDYYYIPYKQRIITPEGVVTTTHVYANGYTIVSEKTPDKPCKIKEISHKDLNCVLYSASEKAEDFNNVNLSRYTKKYYDELPKALKNLCQKSIEAMWQSLVKSY